MERETFTDFCQNMYQKHRYECPRETNYRNTGKPYDEYVLTNLNFLQQEYERQKSEQARKDVDGLYQSGGLHSL